MQKSGIRSICDSDGGLVIDTNHLSRYYGKGRATSIVVTFCKSAPRRTFANVQKGFLSGEAAQ